MGGRLFLDGQQVDLAQLVPTWIDALARVGVGAGSRVLVSPHRPDVFVAVYQACRSLGAVPVVRTMPPSADAAAPLAAAWVAGDTPAQLLALDRGACVRDGAARIVVQTSGSTGAPRYVLQSDAGTAYQTQALVDRLGYQPGMALLLALPPWSAYGLTLVHAWQSMALDLHLVTTVFPRPITRLVADAGIDVVDGTPQFYQLLHRHAAADSNTRARLARVSLWCTGGDVLPPALASGWGDLLEQPLLDGYGSSEAGGNVAINGPDCFRLGTVGKPYPGTQLQIAADGELLVSSPSTCATLSEQGLLDEPTPPAVLATGDLAQLDDDGFVAIRGRKKNVLVINGYKVAPEQVEDVVCRHPGVHECLVSLDRVGPARGVEIVASIVTVEPPPSERELRAFCEPRLPRWAVPHRFVQVPALGYSRNGKLTRKAEPCPNP